MSALGRLYERSGNWNLALDMLKREARIAGASADAVDIHVRMGAIQEDMLLDTGAAKEAYGRALQIDPGCLAAIRAMKGIYERERNQGAFLEQLVSEARYAEDPAEQTRLLTEVGQLHLDERQDREGAARYFEEALKRTPGHLPAARPLSDIYVAAQQWEHAERMLDAMVAALEQSGDAKELCRQAYRQGYVAEKLGKKDKALASYRRAFDLDATYLPALEGLGHLLVAEGQLEEAMRVFTAILIHHREGLTDLEVVETNWQIGELAAKMGQAERAINTFKKALEIDANHEPSRRSLARLMQEAGDWEGAVEQLQRLLPVLDGAGEVRDAGRHRRGVPRQAEGSRTRRSTPSSRRPRSIRPGSRSAEALLGLYRETRQGQKAADVLGQILARSEVQADAVRAAKLQFALGETLRDDVKDEAAALAAFERALDLNPRLVAAFSAIEEILSRQKRWGELEQAYVRMVQRLPKTPDAAPARIGALEGAGRSLPERPPQRRERPARVPGGRQGRPERRRRRGALRRARGQGAGAGARGDRRVPAARGAEPAAGEGGQRARGAARGAKGVRPGLHRRAGGHLPARRRDLGGAAGRGAAAEAGARPGGEGARRRGLAGPAARAAEGAARRHHDGARAPRPADVRPVAQGPRAQPEEGRGGRRGLDPLLRQRLQVRRPDARPALGAALPARRGPVAAAAGLDRADRAGRGRRDVRGAAEEGALLPARRRRSPSGGPSSSWRG